MNLSPFPTINTERLLLRRIVESDWKAVLFLRSDKIINKFIKRSEDTKTKNKTDALLFIQMIHNAVEDNISVSWGITLIDSKEIIGTICLWNFSEDRRIAEVGYDLSPKYQNRGIMSEALSGVVAFGFSELKLDSIEAFTLNENESSRLLLERNGFVLMKDRTDEGNRDNLIFELRN